MCSGYVIRDKFKVSFLTTFSEAGLLDKFPDKEDDPPDKDKNLESF